MNKILYNGNKNIIHRRLYEARTQKNVSQTELAARLQTMNVNIDQQMISRIERNQRQVTDYALICICRSLNVSPEWMLQDFEPDIKIT